MYNIFVCIQFDLSSHCFYLKIVLVEAFSAAMEKDDAPTVLKLSVCLGELGGESGHTGVQSYAIYLAQTLKNDSQIAFETNLATQESIRNGTIFIDELSNVSVILYRYQ